MSDKIVIAGGSGALGSALIKKYENTGTEIVALSRKGGVNRKNVRYVRWNGTSIGPWLSELENSTALINLAGRSVNCRYTERNKKEIIESRVNSVLVLAEAIKALYSPPKVWINAGSAAIFGNSGDVMKQEGDPAGEGFSPDVCKHWERAFISSQTPSTRRVMLRIGLVLQKDKGILKPFLNLAKLGFGGRIGTGKQFISWIHESDFVNLIEWLIKNDEVSGLIHACSPNPVSNKEFMNAISRAINAPVALPNFSLLTRIGAVFIGTDADLVLSGRRVTSRILADKNFSFRFPEIGEAVQHLIKQ